MTNTGGARPRLAAGLILLAMGAAACSSGSSDPAFGADVTRPPNPDMDLVELVDVAAEVGIDFRHGAFQWGTTGDPNAMMGGGLCWVDADADGWLDLFVVNTWSNGEWGRWREEGALPRTQLFRNDRGRFVDATDDLGAGLELRGNGCVVADLDQDGYDDIYVTTERENRLLWNDGGEGFVVDDGSAGLHTFGWQAGAAVGDVNGDGWPDVFVAGYADLNRPVPGATKGFPNPFEAEPDLLFLSDGGAEGERPSFVDVASEVGVEPDQLDYGLGAVFTDVDRDGDLDLYVANDTHPNRLYINEPAGTAEGFRLTDRGVELGVDDEEAGMGIAAADFDGDRRPDIVVTNLAGQGHAAFRSSSAEGPAAFEPALASMDLADLGQERTGWGTTWVDLDLDSDLDLLVAHGAIPISDLDADREQLQAFENLTSNGEAGRFAEVTSGVGLAASGRHLARGLAAADYDNDGDLDLAVGTIGGDLALLRNSGAGGHWLVVHAQPATPGVRVTVTHEGGAQERELLAGSSYLSSEDPRAHFGLGGRDQPVDIEVVWPDGTAVQRSGVEPDTIVSVTRPE